MCGSGTGSGGAGHSQIIKDAKLSLSSNGNDLVVGAGRSGVTPSQINHIKENKQGIVNQLKTEKAIRDKVSSQQLNKQYSKLENKMSDPKLPSSKTNNDAKAAKLVEQANSLKGYNGKESSGLNSAQSSQRNSLLREATKLSSAKPVTTTTRGITQDGRLTLTKTSTNPKTGYSVSKTVSEKVKLK